MLAVWKSAWVILTICPGRSARKGIGFPKRFNITVSSEIVYRIWLLISSGFPVIRNLFRGSTDAILPSVVLFCIARGIAIRPEVLLLDEPCSALDPISTGRIEELITELKQDYTVVIVTHNMQQAARCSDHTAFMYLGELIEFSNTDDLFTKPAKKQTEDYITGRYG